MLVPMFCMFVFWFFGRTPFCFACWGEKNLSLSRSLSLRFLVLCVSLYAFWFSVCVRLLFFLTCRQRNMVVRSATPRHSAREEDVPATAEAEIDYERIDYDSSWPPP